MKKAQQYGWKDGARTRGMDIEAVAPVLQTLERKHGALTPEAVVREATKLRSPLHNWFEWDDTEAARQYRLEQARDLIRAVTVTFIGGDDGEERTVRAFVHLGDPTIYESTVNVLGDVEKRAILLGRMRADFETFRRRYRDMQELVPVFAAFDAIAA